MKFYQSHCWFFIEMAEKDVRHDATWQSDSNIAPITKGFGGIIILIRLNLYKIEKDHCLCNLWYYRWSFIKIWIFIFKKSKHLISVLCKRLVDFRYHFKCHWNIILCKHTWRTKDSMICTEMQECLRMD